MIRVTLSQARYHVLRQNFLAQHKAADLIILVQQLGGLPAAPSTTPFLAASARLDYAAPDQLLDRLNQSQFIATLLMRNTSYIVPVAAYPTFFAATVRQRNQGFNAEFRLWGIEYNTEIEQLGEILLSNWGTDAASAETAATWVAPELNRELTQTSRGGRVTRTTSVAVALRWLAATGRLAVTNGADNWWEYAPLYTPLPTTLNLTDPPTEADAQKALVRAYLATFGPATEADISFWSGFGKSETARAVGGLSNETILTMVEGIPGMLLSLKSQADVLKAVEMPKDPIVNILPANDPYLTAHYASRSRYFADQSLQRQIFSSSDSIKPAILLNGQVVGTWDWQPETQALAWQLLSPIETPETLVIEAEVDRVAGLLGVE